VLGALTEDERRELEGYLVKHLELQTEVYYLGAIASLLALAPQEYEPSPDLRRNLLSRIELAPPTEGPPHRARFRRLFGPGGLAAAATRWWQSWPLSASFGMGTYGESSKPPGPTICRARVRHKMLGARSLGSGTAGLF
jgi:hypothetical protein